MSGLNTSRKHLQAVRIFPEASYLIVSSCIGLSCLMRISSIRRSMWWTVLLRVVTVCLSSSSSPWWWWVCVDNSLKYSSWAACSWGRASVPPRVRLGALLCVCVSGCVTTTARKSVNAFVISIKWLVRCSWTCLLTRALNPYQKLKNTLNAVYPIWSNEHRDAYFIFRFLGAAFLRVNTASYTLRRITPSSISIILHMIRKPNSIIVLLFIQNNS